MKTLPKNLLFLLLVGMVGGFLFSCSTKKSSENDADKLKLILIQYNDSPLSELSHEGILKGMIKQLKTILPDVKKIGTLFTPGEVNSVNNMNDLKKYANAAGIELITVPVNATSEITDATLALAGNRPEVICQIIDNLTSSAFSGIAKIAKEQKIPVFGFVSDQANQGAILVVSRNYTQAGMDAVRLAEKIFKGADPDTIPFEFVSKTDVLINTEAAAKYGITIPGELLDDPDVIKVHSGKKAK